ncbi:MAG: hypothetical protein NTY33_04480 [Candidatus Moranbacteria bacterium]|nr:hypothetical protein [Candidatus Moranbacteria bacterium]
MEIEVHGFKGKIKKRKKAIRSFIVNSMKVSFPERPKVVVSFYPEADRFAGSENRGDFIKITPSCRDAGGDHKAAAFAFAALGMGEGDEVEVVFSSPVFNCKTFLQNGRVVTMPTE